LAEAVARHYLDVGAFPTGNDAAAIRRLLSSSVTGWKGPYLTGTETDATTDPWGRTVLFRRCTTVNGQPATGRLIVSYGPGAPNATRSGTAWTTGANDLFVVMVSSALESRLDEERVARAKQELKTEAGAIYAANPTSAPPSTTLATRDPWNRAYRYHKNSTYSGIVYSRGPDGTDDVGGGDDVYEALVWTP
jgi:hypothetical protein